MAAGIPNMPNHLPDRHPFNRQTPWNANPEIRERLSLDPSGRYKLCFIDPRDHFEWEFIHQYFEKSRPHNRIIKEVRYIENFELTQMFETALPNMEVEAKHPFYKPGWRDQGNPQREQTFERWKRMTDQYSPFSLEGSDRQPGEVFHHVKILPLWQGSSRISCEGISHSGFTITGKHFQGAAAGGTTDHGYFGSANYFTNSARYASMYSVDGYMMLAWVAMREPFPVVADRPYPHKPQDMKMLEGKEHFERYNTHYIPVISIRPADPRCIEYYPCAPGQLPVWDEFAVFDKSQALPRFWVLMAPGMLMDPSLGFVDVSREINDLVTCCMRVDDSLPGIDPRLVLDCTTFKEVLAHIHTVPASAVSDRGFPLTRAIDTLVTGVFSRMRETPITTGLLRSFFATTELKNLEWLKHRLVILKNRSQGLYTLAIRDRETTVASGTGALVPQEAVSTQVQRRMLELRDGFEVLNSIYLALETFISERKLEMKDGRIAQKDQEIADKTQEIADKDRDLHLSQQERDKQAKIIEDQALAMQGLQERLEDEDRAESIFYTRYIQPINQQRRGFEAAITEPGYEIGWKVMSLPRQDVARIRFALPKTNSSSCIWIPVGGGRSHLAHILDETSKPRIESTIRELIGFPTFEPREGEKSLDVSERYKKYLRSARGVYDTLKVEIENSEVDGNLYSELNSAIEVFRTKVCGDPTFGVIERYIRRVEA